MCSATHHRTKKDRHLVSKVPPIILNNGVEMPQLGFGVWQVPDDEAEKAVEIGRAHV